MSDPQSIRVAALYHFTRFDEPETLKPALLAACEEHNVRGTLLLAKEGINGTIAGAETAVEAVLDRIRTLPGCADLEIKNSYADTMPFHRTKVRLKREIVTMGQPDLDPVDGVGTYVDPHDWNELIDDPDTVVIDTRNDYEVGIGTFAGSIDPQTETFGEFPAWFRAKRDELGGASQTKVAMFCTGGIRCEKATAFLKSEGLENVFHLKGGILKYLETVPESESRWQGECFVFDERVSVTHGLNVGTHALCRACRMPLSEDDRASPHYVEGVQCAHCYAERTDDQRERYAERHKQDRLANERGEAHIGAKLSQTGARGEQSNGIADGLPGAWPGFEGRFRD